ncbi:cytochrome c oxidase subunit 1 [Tulasnella sp. 419]|nr:cytochrome c oxidase subunit 1 [Tulasnella sp. 418]KAG8960513.1 cytochrome c oxidase subunit 1 [Tulasnella sp. 419]
MLSAPQIAIQYQQNHYFKSGKSMFLPGSHNDAENMRRILIELYHYKEKNIKLLWDRPGASIDEWPTGENIKKAMKWLTEGLRPGDQRFLYCAGHGHRYEGEEDVFHQALIPVDWKVEAMLRDEDWSECLTNRIVRGAKLTICLDRCFAGNAFDLPVVYELDEEGELIIQPMEQNGNINNYRRHREWAGKILCFSATRANQNAQEIAVGASNVHRGAASYLLTEYLRYERSPRVSDIYHFMREHLQERQHVMISSTHIGDDPTFAP